MKEVLKILTLILTAWLIAASFASFTMKAESQVPTIPMTIEGYVHIQRIDGTQRTVPAGFAVYAKEGTTVINVDDPQRRWITNSSGYYRLGASASADNVPIDLWVKNINVTRGSLPPGNLPNKELDSRRHNSANNPDNIATAKRDIAAKPASMD
jgi:hypothetical protein